MQQMPITRKMKKNTKIHGGQMKGRQRKKDIFRRKIRVPAYLLYGGRNGNPLQYPCLENLVDRGAWWTTVYGIAKS